MFLFDLKELWSGEKTLGRRLVEAGLAWLRRRRKTILTKEYRLARVTFCKCVVKRATPRHLKNNDCRARFSELEPGRSDFG